MKRLFIVSALLLPVLLRAQQQGFTIQGSMSVLKTGKVMLIYDVNGKTVADSADIEDGHFAFSGKVGEPTMMTIRRMVHGYGSDSRSMVLGNDKAVITGTDSFKTIKVTGSALNQEYDDYYAKTFEPFLRNRALIARDTTVAKQVRSQKVDSVKQIFERALEDYVRQHPASFSSILAMQLVLFNASDMQLTAAGELYDGLSAGVKNTNPGKELGIRIKSRKLTMLGAEAPLFTRKDANGQTVNLKELRGKYVFVDFWASWCKPCRAENPHVIAAYNKFKDHNLVVLGVTLDKPEARPMWLAAIKKDGLEWQQVIEQDADGSSVALQYDVTAIPRNFLLDPQGKIIAKDLYDEELMKKLASLLN